MSKSAEAVRAIEQTEVRSFGEAAEVQESPLGRLEQVNIGGVTVERAILEPGWRWSTSTPGAAESESCRESHFVYLISGLFHIRMDDGTEYDCKPGDVAVLAPGHDAWVVGDEQVVVLDFEGVRHPGAGR